MDVRHPKIRKNRTDANRIHRYVIDHDVGFAPNPFHGYCTLANCKPTIRRCALVGDFVMGFGSAASRIRGRLIFWMKVEEIISFDEYWNDARFTNKKPVINGSHIKFHGDNIYHLDLGGSYIQEHSFHSLPDGSVNRLNLETDTGNTSNVLVSKTFGYYGTDAMDVPEALAAVVAEGRGHRVELDALVKDNVEKWLLNDVRRGLRGEPSDWRKIR